MTRKVTPPYMHESRKRTFSYNDYVYSRHSSISRETVRAVIEAADTGMPMLEIAKQFNVSRSWVSSVLRRSAQWSQSKYDALYEFDV